MSKLEDEEVVHCSKCGVPMTEILLCNTRSPCSPIIGSAIKRCKQIICKDCETCEKCDTRLKQLKNDLKRYDAIKDAKDDIRYNWCLMQLKLEFNIDN